MDERYWIEKRKMLKTIKKCAGALIWLSLIVTGIGLWISPWSLGTKLFVFGIVSFILLILFVLGLGIAKNEESRPYEDTSGK